MKFVPAVARLFCLALPGSFLTMFAQNKGELCTLYLSKVDRTAECRNIPSSNTFASMVGKTTTMRQSGQIHVGTLYLASVCPDLDDIFTAALFRSHDGTKKSGMGGGDANETSSSSCHSSLALRRATKCDSVQGGTKAAFPSELGLGQFRYPIPSS